MNSWGIRISPFYGDYSTLLMSAFAVGAVGLLLVCVLFYLTDSWPQWMRRTWQWLQEDTFK